MSVEGVLDPAAWQGHPLNRFRGGILWVLGWIAFQCLLALLIVVTLARDANGLFDTQIPAAFNWAQWLFLAAGPPVVLALLLLRRRLGPILYLVYFLGALAFPFTAELWSPFLTAAETYGSVEGQVRAALFVVFSAIDILALNYLFTAERAKVIFWRCGRVGSGAESAA
ncbi:hypothetical protein KHP62_02795 [Rhodobacteraceae bacterium NNCM2]|nr:hypothetical protein [Coraliihabitans acroporae]